MCRSRSGCRNRPRCRCRGLLRRYGRYGRTTGGAKFRFGMKFCTAMGAKRRYVWGCLRLRARHLCAAVGAKQAFRFHSGAAGGATYQTFQIFNAPFVLCNAHLRLVQRIQKRTKFFGRVIAVICVQFRIFSTDQKQRVVAISFILGNGAVAFCNFREILCFFAQIIKKSHGRPPFVCKTV